MKKTLALIMSLAVAAMSFAGCSKPSGSSAAPASGNAGTTSSAASAAPAAVTKLQLWTFVDQHGQFYKKRVAEWNKENANQQIDLAVTVLPYDDMHNKLLIALQSGVGAPDIADIEISKFPNFMKGTPQLVELNKVLEPYMDKIVKSRVQIYSKDGKYYGIPFHVGATVIYYNMDIMKKAGIDPKTLTTWDQYHEAGKTVKQKTGKPITTFEPQDVFQQQLMVSQLGGYLMHDDGTADLNTPQLAQSLTFMRSMIHDGSAVTAPGGSHSAEEYFGYMNKGGAASVTMPLWYMDRFTQYMPDLKGKVMILPCPVFQAGEKRSVGLGGTGTAITTQSKNPDLAEKFLLFAKLSKEGETAIWNDLGFDPVRTDFWSDPSFKDAKNQFIDYFQDNPFDILNQIKDEIPAIKLGNGYADVISKVKTSTFPKALTTNGDINTILKEDQAALQ